MGWYDPNKRKSTVDKLHDAVGKYVEKYGTKPPTVLVNPNDYEVIREAEAADQPELGGVQLRAARHVPVNTFFVGEDEPVEELELRWEAPRADRS